MYNNSLISNFGSIIYYFNHSILKNEDFYGFQRILFKKTNLIVFLFLFSLNSNIYCQYDKHDYVPDNVIIKFKPGGLLWQNARSLF